jgi:uncharacterized repeat protein (TIGR03803 family)
MQTMSRPNAIRILSLLLAILLIPLTAAHAKASEITTLYVFTGGADGGIPDGELMFGQNGVLYGTTNNGGTGHQGTVFQLKPPRPGHNRWNHSVLFNFPACPGVGNTVSGVIADQDGALYGTTDTGCGTGQFGTVFKLKPPARGQLHWRYVNLTSFVGCPDGAVWGAYPLGGVMFGNDGALYGTTNETCDGSGPGTVFKLKPSASGKNWTRAMLYEFGEDPGNLGGFPLTEVVVGADGNVYGTTPEQSSSVVTGTVYELKAQASDYKPVLLHSFQDPATHGARVAVGPHGGLIMDADGALYGTTLGGGNYRNCTRGCGTVFKLTPPAPGERKWKFTTLYKFTGNKGGSNPEGRLTFGVDGSLYGITTDADGGNCEGDCGITAYRLTPPVVAGTQWSHTVLHSFLVGAGQDEGVPVAGMVFGPDGALYGTTQNGPGGAGSIFRLVP